MRAIGGNITYTDSDGLNPSLTPYENGYVIHTFLSSEDLIVSAGAIGVSLARQKNDPLYKKMMLHKQKYIQTKKQLQKKYKSKANMLARKRANEFKP